MAYVRIFIQAHGPALLLVGAIALAAAGCTEPNPNYRPDPPPPQQDASVEARTGCGDGTCGAGEGCSSCPQDCGRCPSCGDGTCNDGETAATCPQDCGVTCGDGRCQGDETFESCPKDCPGPGGCGDGKCEPPETTASCPADCGQGNCPEGETRCKDDATLETCENGSWSAKPCADACQSAGYDYTTGCKSSSGGSGSVCVCGELGGFGSPCDSSAKCAKGTLCVSFGGTKQGFCTKHCSAVGSACKGAPSGTTAECDSSKINGKHVCVFVCKQSIDCPQGLTCKDPMFDGYCAP